MRNLQTVYRVQRCSGVYSTLFPTYEDAQKAIKQWRDEVYAEFENGNSAYTERVLNADGFGGCTQDIVVADYALPGGIHTHKLGTLNKEDWVDNPGFDRIRWGSLATARK